MPTIFVCYSREDSRWVVTPKGATEPALIPWLRDKFRRHPAGIELWWDEALDRRVGEAYDAEIASAIASSQTAILLVSDDFFISDYISQHELPKIRERVERGEMQLFPIVVGHVDWGQNADSLWLQSRQIHPSAISPLIEVIESPSAWNRTRTQLSVALRDQVLSFKPRRPGESAPEKTDAPPPMSDDASVAGWETPRAKVPFARNPLRYAAIALVVPLVALGIYASMRSAELPRDLPPNDRDKKPVATVAPTPTRIPNAPTPTPTHNPFDNFESKVPPLDPFPTPAGGSPSLLSAAEQKALKNLKTPINFRTLEATPFRQFLDTIKLLSGIDYFVYGDLDIDELKISGLNFDDKPLDQVLDVVCTTYNLKWKFRPTENVIVVEASVTLESRDFPIPRNPNPFTADEQHVSECRNEVDALLYAKTGKTKAAAEGRVTNYDAKTNTLTVRDTPKRLDEVASLLKRKGELPTSTRSNIVDPFGGTPTPRSQNPFGPTPTPSRQSPFGEPPPPTPSPTPRRYF